MIQCQFNIEGQSGNQLFADETLYLTLPKNGPCNVCEKAATNKFIKTQINVFVKTQTGKTFHYDVMTSDTVQNLKAKIEDIQGIPVKFQSLIFKDKLLTDDFTFSQYGIKGGITIILFQTQKVLYIFI